MTLLSVDWDFFWPEPFGLGIGDPKRLYDWGTREDLVPGIMDYLWHSRAAGFLRNEMELPRVNDEWRTFWQKFDLSKCEALFVGNSHMWAGSAAVAHRLGDWTEVVNFDAHHDLGYGFPLIGENDQYTLTCENWLSFYSDVVGSLTTVVYPNWKINAFKLEPHYQAESPTINRMFDREFTRIIEPTVVVVARSGAWVPPWCDNAFNEFVALFPKNIKPVVFDQVQNIPGWDRKYDPEVAQKIQKTLDEVVLQYVEK